MAFQVVQERQFTAKLKAIVPVDNGSKDETFRATYRVITSDDLAEYDLTTKDGTDAFLRAVIVELHDLTDDDGQPLHYNDQVRDQVIVIPYARRPLIDGYFENTGRARKGN